MRNHMALAKLHSSHCSRLSVSCRSTCSTDSWVLTVTARQPYWGIYSMLYGI